MVILIVKVANSASSISPLIYRYQGPTHEYNVGRRHVISRDEQTCTVPVDQAHNCELAKPNAT